MTTIEIVEKIEALRKELPKIFEDSASSNNTSLAWDRINRWKERTARVLDKLVSPSEGKKLEDASPSVFSMGDPWGTIRDEINSYDSHLLALLEEIRNNPEFVLSTVQESNDDLVSVPSDLSKLEKLCRRFHKVAKQLRNRHQNRTSIEIEDEYDVQDLFHALLKIEFDDIRPEEWTPSYAGSSARTDFLLKQEKVVIEIKKTRKTLGDKEIGEQLIIDIERYQNHPECKLLICFVYDPEGRIGNPQGIIKDLEERSRALKLRVIIEPEG